MFYFAINKFLRYKFRSCKLKLKKEEKKLAGKLIEKLISRYRWHNTILRTHIPNVACLRCEKITLINSYGQRREYDFSKKDDK